MTEPGLPLLWGGKWKTHRGVPEASGANTSPQLAATRKWGPQSYNFKTDFGYQLKEQGHVF
jgi:hypothetical protein